MTRTTPQAELLEYDFQSQKAKLTPDQEHVHQVLDALRWGKLDRDLADRGLREISPALASAADHIQPGRPICPSVELHVWKPLDMEPNGGRIAEALR